MLGYTLGLGFEQHLLSKHGGIAQLGERLHGMQEVSGSIPLTSTNIPEQGLFEVAKVSKEGSVPFV